jgi:acid phosphatase type 7
MNTIRRSFRAAVLTAAAASVLALAGRAKAQDSDTHNNSWPHPTTHKSPVLAVVGDISCQPGETEPSGEKAHENCGTPASPYTSTSLWESQEATANQIEAMQPDAVALLGDLQYQVGQYQDFEQSFDLTYGAFKFLTRPAPGNHEFYDEHGATGVAGYGYFSYYNGFQVNPSGQPITVTLADPCPSTQTGCSYTGLATTTSGPQPVPRSDGQAGHFEQTGGVGATIPAGGTVGVADGWYSYNIGSWHLISLNIECETHPGGCSPTGPWLAAETEWLKKDLEENHSACTAAYWHQPTFSAADSLTEEGITSGTWWQLLYDAGADLVLNGHDHLYARYAPIRPYFDASDTSVTGVTGTWLGTSDPNRGIREFIVGTGGETLDTVVSAPTSPTDWDGKFNQQFLEAATGNYWGVMALALDEHGYRWDYESALLAPVAPSGTAAGYSDKGYGSCHGGHNW